MFTFDRVHFLNTPFDVVSEQTVHAILKSIDTQAGFEYVVTPNADHVVRNQSRPDLCSIYERALISVCDSRVVSRLARFKGYPLTDVVTGSDLTAWLFAQMLGEQHSITIIGGDCEVVDALRKKYSLGQVFHYNPPMGFIRNELEISACCEFVCQHKADFVFLAVGSPQQEVLAERLKMTQGCVGVAFCIGASLLFLTGKEKRAPLCFSRLGVEWLYRLMQDPKRLWRRYLENFKIFRMVMDSPAFVSPSSKRNVEGKS